MAGDKSNPAADLPDNPVALQAFANDLNLNLPWIETLTITAKDPHNLTDPEDELKRELGFYNQALQAVKAAKPLVLQAGVPFGRPDDYFAEM
ncbi:RRNA processing protein, partial [Tieghemiomyces parasiticus]